MNFLFKQEIIDYEYINNKANDTILFLHGWGGNKNSFIKTFNLLKQKFNIITLTLPTIENTTTSFDLFDYITIIENILKVNNICSVIIICHSFGFRIASLLNIKLCIKKIVVTGGAGLIRKNIFKRVETNNNKILLQKKRFGFLHNKLASSDYKILSNINKQTFKNIVNLNLKFASKFKCKMLLFWGKNDKETRPWIAKFLSKHNQTKTILTKGNHFTYINEFAKFNNEVLKFLYEN